ncbi:septation ring formation regulator EzrA [Aneurinibacillus thermoaerophilus]|uniref:septation ring formation regulator EzrA n=1 Tax=Aneurinibacillus thermoaerophilus TaxID=143495 RepID=UPI002E1AADDD|nr:septation ring formation regulator EzrA [Aneurinibacillus thermoaerophilus]MED0738064.1 septation ring formation regulator EzrA [Aneurinibacillus thermoaerophilus]
MSYAIQRMFRFFIALVASVAILAGPCYAQAAPMPASLDKPVIDINNVMKSEEEKKFINLTSGMKQTYKLVVIADAKPLTLQQYAQKLLETFTIEDKTMVMVLSASERNMVILSGKYFKENGINQEVLQHKMEHYFEPYAKQGTLMTGVISFVEAVDEELKAFAQKQGSGEQVKMAGISASAATQDVTSWPVWLLGGLILLAVASVGAAMAYTKRGRILKEVDEVDEWRGKVADQLNSFEIDSSWKKEPGRIKEKYLAILTSLDDLKKDAIADVELILVDAEENLMKFRFKRGQEIIQEAKDKLFRIEEEYRNLHIRLGKLQETLQDIVALKEETKQLQQKNERRLDELRIQYSVSFHVLKEEMNQFDREMQAVKQAEEKGDFEDARACLQQAAESQRALMDVMQKVPLIRQTIVKDLDQEIRQLDEDAKEMVAGGYTSGEEFFNARIVKIRGKYEKLPILFEEGKITEAEELIIKIREDIESVYQTMEEIVTNRHQYRQYVVELPYYLKVLKQDEEYLAGELHDLSQRYLVEDGEAFHYYQQIPAVIADIENALEQISASTEKDNYERHGETLTQVAERVNQMMERRELVMKELKVFRQGEVEAHEELQDMRASVTRVEQQLKRLHLSKVPYSVTSNIQICRQAIDTVEEALGEVPLKMQKVDHVLKEAKEHVSELLEQAAEMIRDIRLAEDKIQRTNRFRRYDKEIARLLQTAEDVFREAEYGEAHELADQAFRLAQERYGLDVE